MLSSGRNLRCCIGATFTIRQMLKQSAKLASPPEARLLYPLLASLAIKSWQLISDKGAIQRMTYPGPFDSNRLAPRYWNGTRRFVTTLGLNPRKPRAGRLASPA